MNIKEMTDEFLVCPKCRESLEYRNVEDSGKETEILICRNCSVYYPVEDGIPILLIEEAKLFLK